MKFLSNYKTLIHKSLFMFSFIVCCGLNLHINHQFEIEIKDLDKVFEIARKEEESADKNMESLAVSGEHSA